MKARDPGLERFRHADTRVIVPAAGQGAVRTSIVRAGIVRAYIVRDTGAGSPPHLNRFPAAPYCTLTWFLAGAVHDGDSAAAPALAPVVVGGPFTRPATTFSAGRVHAFTVVFYPDAFRRMTGLAPAALADSLVPADAVLPPSWHALLDEVSQAHGDADRIGCLDAFLADRWDGPHATSAGHWLRRLCIAAGIDRLCERQIERRIRQATGQTLRALRREQRFETTLLTARAAAAEGRLDWARLAGDSGYADQPHLGRECRKLSGTSPADLIARQQGDESYWLFRHWR